MWVATPERCKLLMIVLIFQLTPPMWVATNVQRLTTTGSTDFNSRHPCGWRLVDSAVTLVINISTHATHVGGDVQAVEVQQP